MSNIVLIGMPGCGKSTIGVILAKTLGIGFVDTDLIIQQRENRLLQDIIDKDGIDFFLNCEADAVKTVLCDNTVIATGGSVVYREDAIKHLKKNGKTLLLHRTKKQNDINEGKWIGIGGKTGLGRNPSRSQFLPELIQRRERRIHKRKSCLRQNRLPL